MKVMFLVMSLLSASVAQASIICSMADKAIDVAVVTFADTFKCQKREAIELDIKDVINYEERCQETSSDSLLEAKSVMCKTLASTIAVITADKIPANWECDKDHSEQVIKDFVNDMCEKIEGSLSDSEEFL